MTSGLRAVRRYCTAIVSRDGEAPRECGAPMRWGDTIPGGCRLCVLDDPDALRSERRRLAAARYDDEARTKANAWEQPIQDRALHVIGEEGGAPLRMHFVPPRILAPAYDVDGYPLAEPLRGVGLCLGTLAPAQLATVYGFGAAVIQEIVDDEMARYAEKDALALFSGTSRR